MTTIAAGEIKRRGIVAVDGPAGRGPVGVIRNNRLAYVVMTEEEYGEMLADLADARLAASEADLKAGRTGRGGAGNLMKEIRRAR